MKTLILLYLIYFLTVTNVITLIILKVIMKRQKSNL
jgi:hypothetical protein